MAAAVADFDLVSRTGRLVVAVEAADCWSRRIDYSAAEVVAAVDCSSQKDYSVVVVAAVECWLIQKDCSAEVLLALMTQRGLLLEVVSMLVVLIDYSEVGTSRIDLHLSQMRSCW